MSQNHFSDQPDAAHLQYETDAHTPPTRAIVAGVVAALAAGGLWALMVHLTGYEIGYAAWGVGLLVGLAMARATPMRSRRLATIAAACAVLGLFAGKAFIFWSSASVLAGDLSKDDEAMRATVAWMMYDERSLDQATLDEIDGAFETEGVLSDEVWESMMNQAHPRLSALTPDERDALAKGVAQSFMQQVGFWNGIANQLSGFDLLWIALAVGTAFRIMMPGEEGEDVESQEPAEPEAPQETA